MTNDNVKCPICKKEKTSKLLKQWEFRKYDVSRYECSSCKEKFNIYERYGKTIFIIPK